MKYTNSTQIINPFLIQGSQPIMLKGSDFSQWWNPHTRDCFSIVESLFFFLFLLQNKRDFTKEKQRITIGWKPLHFIMISWYHWIKKKVNHLSCIEGGLIDICCITHNLALCLFLYDKISLPLPILVIKQCVGLVAH